MDELDLHTIWICKEQRVVTRGVLRIVSGASFEYRNAFTNEERVKHVYVGAARREAGYQLYRLQLGLDPTDWKPMRWAGVIEIRIHAGGEYRVFYAARFAEAVYVLHAFEKRTRQTRQADIELGRKNLAEALRSRRSKTGSR